jgi:hypothetical protein
MSKDQCNKVADFLSSQMNKLITVHDSVEPFLDFEPFSHPGIGRILDHYKELGFRPVMDTVPTTGIAISQQNSPESVFGAASRHAVRSFMLTVYGPQSVHEAAIGNGKLN